MIKHMHDNYINAYEWFMRADDDVYIRPDRLEELLRSVDSKKMWFIGQTGRGNSEEFGLLSLDSDENFCMGGPGVIFSRETLKRVAPFVEDCLRHLYTTHEDVELGRCVRRFAGVSCTWSYQMQVIFYHNQSGYSAFTGDLKQKEIHQAITLHPVKHPEHLYRLHKYFKSLKIQSNQHDSLNLERDLSLSLTMLGYEKHLFNTSSTNYLSASSEQHSFFSNSDFQEVPMSISSQPPENLNDVYEWEFMSSSLYSAKDLNPKRRIGSSLKEGLQDVIVEVMELINHFSKQRGRLIEFKEIMYSYWRVNPLHGVEYILDLLLVYRKYRGHKMTIQVRRHAYVQQIFTASYIRDSGTDVQEIGQFRRKSIPVHKQIKHALINLHRNLKPFFEFSGKKPDEIIHFILPLSGRYKIFERFMKSYREICLVPKELTTLHIILYNNIQSPEDLNKTTKLVKSTQEEFHNCEILISFKNEKFSRGRALQHGVDNLKTQDLMLFVDVDMIFNKETLERIRLNTISNKSVYFPIVFSLYNPKLFGMDILAEKYSWESVTLIDDYNGFWRQFGFGIGFLILFREHTLKTIQCAWM
ncbi:hypothetical protein HHI36_013159 [Cryptolaemus montrouzieri]|uniref:Hexosyltransferase n=1 Tax=Cryptolaemus montrouzieri TaxID=559131 RepID=A0ABD2NHD4_9CUCU